MRTQFSWLSMFLIGFICLHSTAFAVPPGDSNEEIAARDRIFLQKAQSGKLDCVKEILQGEREFSDERVSTFRVYDVDMWRTFGTQQCFKALLKAKDFDAAVHFVDSAKPSYLNKWRELALEDSIDVPVYATDAKCKSGEQQYTGNEQARLITALLKGSNFRNHPPGRRAALEGVLTRLSDYEDIPACMSKKAVIDLINKFIDLGLESKFWWEEPMVVGGLTTFSGVMRLGDESLVNRILSGGLNQQQKYVVYLFARAPSVEMIKVLERYYKLKRSEYKAVLQIIEKEKKFPVDVRRFGAGAASPEVIEYFERQAK